MQFKRLTWTDLNRDPKEMRLSDTELLLSEADERDLGYEGSENMAQLGYADQVSCVSGSLQIRPSH